MNVLEKQVAELIAAGEVVERPASIAKELVENSIDAGASSITVEVEKGGIGLLRVTDNGEGISAGDVPTAFIRHATSKVRSETDLQGIHTMGFRGEALPSICAMSRVEVLTRTQQEPFGTRFVIEGGEQLVCEETGTSIGTVMTVRDVFFNTPARMKFLKKESTEASNVGAFVEKAALSHPEIAFRFIKDGETKLRSPGDGELLSAIRAVLGTDIAKTMVPVNYTRDNVTVTGYITQPSVAKGNRGLQHFYINRRLVQSKTCMAALEEAYKGKLMVGRFPGCVLNLQLSPQLVDVNVHPAKIQVRFADERAIFHAVYYGVKSALELITPTGTLSLSSHCPPSSGAAAQSAPTSASMSSLAQAGGNSNPPASAGTPHWGRSGAAATQGNAHTFAGATAQSAPTSAMMSGSAQTGGNGNPPASAGTPHWGRSGAVATPETATGAPGWGRGVAGTPMEAVARNVTEKDEKIRNNPALQIMGCANDSTMAAEKYHQALETARNSQELQRNSGTVREGMSADGKNAPYYAEGALLAQPEQMKLESVGLYEDARLVGEVFDTYILLENGRELLVVDKHAAHERLLYNRLKEQGVGKERQMLLAPLQIPLASEEYATVLEHLELFSKGGLELEDFGDGSVVLREVAPILQSMDCKLIVEEFSRQLAKGDDRLHSSQLERLYDTIACRSAIKGGDKTPLPSLEQLISLLKAEEDAACCPHGRPVCIRLSRRELEKSFGRLG